MRGGEAAEIVLADTSVLLNLAFVERLDLLGALEGYRFRIPEEVAAEVRRMRLAAPAGSQTVSERCGKPHPTSLHRM